MEDKVVYPKTEQLIIKTIGTYDKDLGIRFSVIENEWSRGFRIINTIKLKSENEFMFILERNIK